MNERVGQLEKEKRELGEENASQKKVLAEMKESLSNLGSLIDEERGTYNEERERFERDLEGQHKAGETKVKILKSKLIGFFDGSPESAKQLSLDELVDHIAFRLSSLGPLTSQRSHSIHSTHHQPLRKEETPIRGGTSGPGQRIEGNANSRMP